MKLVARLLNYFYIPLFAVFIFGINARGLLTGIPLAVIFGLLPLLDWVLGLNTDNPDAAREARERHARHWAPPLFVYAIFHFALLAFAAFKISETTDGARIFLLSFTVGVYTGGFGITAAHELMHRRDGASRLLSNILLASVGYQHFYIEHLYGHHLRVATLADPASARRGESFFRFLPRTLFGSYRSAWRIELNRRGILRNRLLPGHLLTLIFFGACSAWGWSVGLFFVIQSVTAFIILELVNYVEHYGLSRGVAEKVRPEHSWNSSHMFSNAMLFNLQRHSDHHANAGRPFTILKHHDRAPQLPSGYAVMILIALIPPLWFRVMDNRL